MALIEPVRWGIVATGNISTAFTKDLAELPDAEVVAVGSRSEQTADTFADRFGIPHRYGSYQELIADAGRSGVEVVYIGNTIPQHYAVAQACLDAGLAVLCEKPVTLNARQARTLVELSRARGVLFAEAMWMRTNPVVKAMYADLAAGVIGEPTQVIADFGLHIADLPRRLLDPELGGGALLDLGVYPATLAYWVLGRPDEVKAVGRLSDEGVDLHIASVWRYDRGAVASLTCGLTAQNPCTAAISGPEGSLLLPGPFFNPGYYLRHTSAGEERIEIARTGIGYHYEAAEVMAALRAGQVECQALPHADTVGVLELLDEVRQQVGVRYPGDDE